MTQNHSALLAQLDALKSADAPAVFAELIRAGLQAVAAAPVLPVGPTGSIKGEQASAMPTESRQTRRSTFRKESGHLKVALVRRRTFRRRGRQRLIIERS